MLLSLSLPLSGAPSGPSDSPTAAAAAAADSRKQRPQIPEKQRQEAEPAGTALKTAHSEAPADFSLVLFCFRRLTPREDAGGKTREKKRENKQSELVWQVAPEHIVLKKKQHEAEFKNRKLELAEQHLQLCLRLHYVRLSCANPVPLHPLPPPPPPVDTHIHTLERERHCCDKKQCPGCWQSLFAAVRVDPQGTTRRIPVQILTPLRPPPLWWWKQLLSVSNTEQQRSFRKSEKPLKNKEGQGKK